MRTSVSTQAIHSAVKAARRPVRWRSLTGALVLAMIISLLLPSLVGGSLSTRLREGKSRRLLEMDLSRHADVLASALAEPVWNLDTVTIKAVVEAVMRDPRLVRVSVVSSGMGSVVEVKREERHLGRSRELARNILKGDTEIGRIEVEIDDGLQVLDSQRERLSDGAILGIQFVLAFALMLALMRIRFIAPMQRLMEFSDRIANGNLGESLQWRRSDEIGRLADQLELMRVNLQTDRQTLEDRVAQRTAELSKANANLHRAMRQLVQSEKLAALGGLVAGVAHELNTPLGNAVTVVTTLQHRIAEFRAAVDGQALRRSQMVAFLEGADEACALLERNTHRAADLVTSFKQVAVDQSSMRRRNFALAAVVKETLQTVSPLYKHKPVNVVTEVPGEIEMDSFPGPLEQVITNLINNAVIHALGERTVLNISISASLAMVKGESGVRLSMSDDGMGMAPETVARAFDPFFTTRLGHGGSGLGLYLVHTLVTGPLGGSLELSSTPQRGTVFAISLPLRPIDSTEI